MSHVKGRDTSGEKIIRSMLHRMGYRFRLYRRDLPGCPDLVFAKRRKIVFFHGCFWHQHTGCKRAARPESNRDFWNRKLDETVERDSRNMGLLREMGWQVLIIWGCEIKDTESLRAGLLDFLER